jgi:hypothetical protein
MSFSSLTDLRIAETLVDRATLIWAVAVVEVQYLIHDPLELLTRSVHEVMTQVRRVSPGLLRYLDFLAAAILAQSVLFVAIFYGISAIWERDLGVQRYLVSPAPRSALVMGKALSTPSTHCELLASSRYALRSFRLSHCWSGHASVSWESARC